MMGNSLEVMGERWKGEAHSQHWNALWRHSLLSDTQSVPSPPVCTVKKSDNTPQ
jgi:hypothetical protein